MRRNLLREALRDGRPTFGTNTYNVWPSVVEMIGYTGAFDYVQFTAEYNPFDLAALDNLCRAAELHGLSMMIKLDQEPRKFLAQRAIGSGFQAVKFADVRTVSDAKECVAAVRPDTPTGGGTYGSSDRRFAYWAETAGERYVQALNDIVIILMIEKRSALDHIDEILAVRGIDMVQWGPTDFSMSSGRAGQFNHPDVKAAERHLIERSQAAGIPAIAALDRPDQAPYYVNLGVTHFDMGSDLWILHDWLKENGQELRRIVGDKQEPREQKRVRPTELSTKRK